MTVKRTHPPLYVRTLCKEHSSARHSVGLSPTEAMRLAKRVTESEKYLSRVKTRGMSSDFILRSRKGKVSRLNEVLSDLIAFDVKCNVEYQTSRRISTTIVPDSHTSSIPAGSNIMTTPTLSLQARHTRAPSTHSLTSH